MSRLRPSVTLASTDPSELDYLIPHNNVRWRDLRPQHLPGAQALPRHRHAQPYAAIVLAGRYLECGDEGRFEATDGAVVVHGSHQAHLNVVAPAGAHVINVPMSLSTPTGLFSCKALDSVMEALRGGDGHRAAELLLATIKPVDIAMSDWPDMLASAIRCDPTLIIGDWACERKLTPAQVSRGFRQVFGVSPKRFRAEAKARAAFERLHRTSEKLAFVAVAAGFTDQPHMNKAVVRLTGKSPSAIRRD
ncbi:AraC family transcriptional regulator [Sphingomonas koreensis]|nr:AraC family transcriptional regulator [Sphingomonas koreensis]